MAVNVKGGNAQQNRAQGDNTNQNFAQGVQNNGPLHFGIQSRVATFGSGGEVFEKLYDKINSKVKYLNDELKTEEKYAVIKLLKQNAGLHYSAIVVTESLSNITSAHILMIEKTGEYPEKLTENIGGVRYEITRTPADALDEKYISQATIAVADALKVSQDSVVITDGTLVPNEFDVNSDNQVTELLNNTFNAITSENAIRVSDYKGMNLQQLMADNRNGKFFINLFFNGDETTYFDQTGLPIRQDICIATTYKVGGNQNNKSINQGLETYDIVKVYGYMDFEFVGPSIINGMVSSQKFVPNFIITHIESSVAPTPDILTLAVASVLALNEDLNWMQSFRSKQTQKNEVDYGDIGALNVEGNIENSPTGYGKKYDTKSKTFTVAELNKLIQMLVRPNIIVSIDVPKAGPETWFTSVLQYIKFRNDKAAYERVANSISNLTNGIYQHGNVPMFTEISNKIHGGFYKAKEGFKDTRQLSSYLSFANFVSDTNQAPALISQYTNTLYNNGIPAELRAAERRKYIDEMSNKTAVYKQYYDRLTFNAAWLVNVVNSLKQAGFNPVFNNMGQVNDMFVRRSTVDFASAMLGTDARIMGQNNMFGSFYMPYNYNRTF